MLERLNEEIKRRTHAVRIFPNTEGCLRLVQTLAVETNEHWARSPRLPQMNDLKGHKNNLRQAADFFAGKPSPYRARVQATDLQIRPPNTQPAVVR